MKVFFHLTIIILFCSSTLTPFAVNGQTLKTLGKIAKWAGKTISTVALEKVVDKQLDYYFNDDYNENNTQTYFSNGITVSVINDYSNYITYFWVTTDGVNWQPWALYPGYYFTVQSGNNGVIGIFNGYDVQFINQQGTYNASYFFN